MSLKVNWDGLESESFTTWTKELLTEALNSGKKPPILASNIDIVDLSFGKTAPNFEILEIGELGKDRFRGIFKMTYDGDFHLTLHTRVQANPLNIYDMVSKDKEVNPDHDNFVTPNFLLASAPFALPLNLKLSDLRINAIGTIVFSRSKGLTVVFRNDPLDSIKVSSTFDAVQALANFLQKQIEQQVRDLFREVLPTVLHHMSLKYISVEQPDLVNLNSSATKLYDIATFDTNLSYSQENLYKNLMLYASRETMRLDIPKFKNIIQRTIIERSSQQEPNLSNMLNASLNLNPDFPQSQSTGISIDYFADTSKVNKVLKEVSQIQSKSYYKLNNNGAKPKRRSLKLNRSKAENQTKIATDPVSRGSFSSSDTAVSAATENIFTKLEQPRPMRVNTDFGSYPLRSFDSCFNPTSASPGLNSMLGNVGLGNPYFAMTNPMVSTSPVRGGRKVAKNKKSMNHIDIGKINGKKEDEMKDEKRSNSENESAKAEYESNDKISAKDQLNFPKEISSSIKEKSFLEKDKSFISKDRLLAVKEKSYTGKDELRKKSLENSIFELPPPPYQI